ncbi:hypothetical protein BRD00_06570 [Halobacteriales archaeon QS_8_69_26]|nr:MAG: hypothetical protein BRD00_06570 [Halobacteriales archaeon QS_8_69_26]
MTADSRDRVDRILDPDSVAIAGASADETKRGYIAMERLVESAYAGEVNPVNPSYEGEILGRTVYPAVSEVPETVDLVYVVTPPDAVADVLADAGRADAAGAVIFSAGFGEAGNEEAERELVRVAEETGIRFIGPNVMGMVNAPADMYLGIDATYAPGEFAVVSQSGNLAMNLGMQSTRARNTGISYLVSIGNEADLTFHELLPHFGADDHTGALLLYAEGMSDGRSFLQAAAEFPDPVVAVRGGRTGAGKSSAASHTASLAGDADVVEAVYDQAGVVTVADFDDTVPVAQALTGLPPLSGRNVAVMTEAGGLATIATDALVEGGLSVPELTEETRSELRELFPYSPNVSNPVDTMVTPRTATLHGDAAEAILSDPNVDGLLICGEYGGYGLTDTDGPDLPADEDTLQAQIDSAERIARLPEEYGKPVVIKSTYTPEESEALATCRDGGIPVYDALRHAPAAFSALAQYGEYLDTADRRTDFVVESDRDPHEAVDRAAGEGRRHLAEYEARDVLADYGVPVAPHRLATAAEEAVAAAAEFEGRVAMKVASPGIQHKTEAGGVSLDVAGEGVRHEYDRLMESARAYDPDATVEGVLVSPMVEEGVEVIVGAVDDAEVGPVMLFGVGGVLVEVLEDVSFGAVPLTEYDARRMIEGIRASEVLAGARGRPGVDREALVDLLLSVSDVVAANPAIAELDLNPVVCHEDGLSVVDASIGLSGSDDGR